MTARIHVPRHRVGPSLSEYLRMIAPEPVQPLRKLVSSEGGNECDLELALAFTTRLLRRTCLDASWGPYPWKPNKSTIVGLAAETALLLHYLRHLADNPGEPIPADPPTADSRPSFCQTVLREIQMPELDRPDLKKKSRKNQKVAIVHVCRICGWESPPCERVSDWKTPPVRVCSGPAK